MFLFCFILGFFVKTFVPPSSFIAFYWSIDSKQRYKNLMAPRGTLIIKKNKIQIMSAQVHIFIYCQYLHANSVRRDLSGRETDD